MQPYPPCRYWKLRLAFVQPNSAQGIRSVVHELEARLATYHREADQAIYGYREYVANLGELRGVTKQHDCNSTSLSETSARICSTVFKNGCLAGLSSWSRGRFDSHAPPP